MNSGIATHTIFPEPKLSFHPERTSDCDIHPLAGLVRYGPYSKGIIPDPIRVATIFPKGGRMALVQFMNELKRSYDPRERTDYLRPWPGFSQVFRLNFCSASSQCHLELDEKLDDEISNSATPHLVLADHLLRSINVLSTLRSEFEVIVISIPQRWSAGFSNRTGDDFDLHDHLKASTAARSIPIQIVRDESALKYPDRASVMWRIGLALYTKAGGVPWKLVDSQEETAYIGLSYALRPVQSGQNRFVTCCSQVFDEAGTGLEFIAYDANEVNVEKDNPFLSKTEMFRVMTRSLELYRRRHPGRTPRKIMVHKSTEFKRDEIDGCMEAFHLCESVDLVQIVDSVGWRGVKIEQPRNGGPKGQPAPFPIDRGTLVELSDRDCLLWVHGNVSGISRKGAYFQGGRSTPRPIRLIRHAGHGPWDDTANAVLALSKMNWNNDALYDHMPVTMSYAQVLARIVKRMPKLGNSPYQFRFFM